MISIEQADCRPSQMIRAFDRLTVTNVQRISQKSRHKTPAVTDRHREMANSNQEINK